MSTPTFSVKPIAWVQSQRADVTDDDWGDVISPSRLILSSSMAMRYEGSKISRTSRSSISLIGVQEDSFGRRARRPRNNPDWPEVGIFAQRNKRRPNRIGVSVCELLTVSETELEVRGLDAIDRTPVLDIKPYMTEFAPRSAGRQPRWSRELMSGYWQVSAT